MSMIKTKSRGLLIVISGPSGAGKGTICGRLKEQNRNIWISTSMTTRDARKGERNGIDYYFVSKEEFEEKIKNDGFLEYAIVHHGNYYGTPKDKIEEKLEEGRDVILEIDIQGALKVQEQAPDALFIFIVPPTMDALKERLIKRNTEDEEKILERFKKAYIEINEIQKYNYVVVNDRVDVATNKVDAIITAEKCRVARIEEVDLENKEGLMHESLTEGE